MKALLTLLILGLFFTACTNEPTQNSGIHEPAPLSMIEPIETPFREQGYSHYPSKLITSQTQLDRFLTEVSNGDNWNNQTNFLEKLQDERIDFEHQNLLFY